MPCGLLYLISIDQCSYYIIYISWLLGGVGWRGSDVVGQFSASQSGHRFKASSWQYPIVNVACRPAKSAQLSYHQANPHPPQMGPPIPISIPPTSPPSRPLRIAILEADTPLPLTHAKYNGYGGVFRAFLETGAESLGWKPERDLRTERWDVVSVRGVQVGEYPRLEDVDAVLVTGSRESLLLFIYFEGGHNLIAKAGRGEETEQKKREKKISQLASSIPKKN